MAVKIIDLQLIYGVAGAREKFEELSSQLVRGEQPAAARVRVSKGDGGIDVHVGELTSPGGIDVYQCKFFPHGLDESQKGQIRESFKTCRENFTLKRWVLCLPIDLSGEEKRWFETWRKAQAKHGVEIPDPWDGTKLEGLLYQSKNQGLRDVYFKEEHLAQIRELYETLTKLIPDIAARLQFDAEERQEGRRSAELARQERDLEGFVGAARDRFTEVMSAVVTSGVRPSHWEVIIRPAAGSDAAEIETLRQCREIVEACQVRSNGWEYPRARYQTESEDDWIGITHPQDSPEVECWRISQRGAFVHLSPVFDDLHGDRKGMRIIRPDHTGFIPSKFLDIDVAVRLVTHAFRFAANLAEHPQYPAADELSVTVRLTGTKDRVLDADDSRRLRDRYRATGESIEKTWTIDLDRLRADPDQFAVKAAAWLFERFNWHDSTEESARSIQQRIFAKFPRRRLNQ